MKNRKTSCTRSFLTFATFIALSSAILSCATSNSAESSSETKPAEAGEIPDEVSLKADRSAFADERKNIPEDTKKENDELASILSMMSNADEDPSKVRDRFSTALRKKREKNDKILRMRREDFTKKQRTDREAFLKKAQATRTDYMKNKHTSDERKAFFDKQEDARKSFFDAASERAKDFDSKMNEDRKNFEDYARERQNTFNAALRTYTETYQDRKSNLEKKRRADQKARQMDSRTQLSGGAGAAGASEGSTSGAGSSDPLNEWKSIPKTPGTELTPQGH